MRAGRLSASPVPGPHARMLGYAWEEVVGRVTPLLFHLPDELAEKAHFLGVSGTADFSVLIAGLGPDCPAVEADWTYVRKDGSVIWVRVSASFIRDASGRPVRRACASRPGMVHTAILGRRFDRPVIARWRDSSISLTS